MSGGGESRHELLAWLNDLTDLNITKVEQCGKGDVPFRKVDLNAHNEYQYIQNWKVLQALFNKHEIERAIPIERLARCKMQDNLEFLQFSKRYWDQYFTGDHYDAAARRQRTSLGATAANRVSHATPTPRSGAPAARKTAAVRTQPAPQPRPVASGASRLANGVSRAAAPPASAQQLQQLEQESEELREQAEGLEKERDFYFSRLRDMEILIQEQSSTPQGAEDLTKPESFLARLQALLYQTEEGFEVPTEAIADQVDANYDKQVDEFETF